MKKLLLLPFVTTIIFGCGSTVPPSQPVAKPRSLAESAPVRLGPIEQTVAIPATTVYQQRSILNAPINGFISRVLVHPGEIVHTGQLLYVIESREKSALGQWPSSSTTTEPDTTANAFGVFKVTAPTNGYIIRMDQQQPGTFVTEGLLLCVVADPATVRFQLDVPFEQISLVQKNAICRIRLPDGTAVQARIVQPLTQVNPGSQAAPYLAIPQSHGFLPEGLIASASMISEKKKDALLIPKNAILSDELMRHFWVMRVDQDSVAIKTPISLGLANDSLAEVIGTGLRPGDNILVRGNYGLPDTARVILSSSTASIRP